MKESKKDVAFIVAGGTGGHINSALAVGALASKKGLDVYYFSGSRHLDYKLYKGTNCHHLSSSSLRDKSPIGIIKSIYSNIQSFLIVLKLVLVKRPKFVFGAGGYVCGPVMLAGKLGGSKLFILEQNSVAGLTNRILSKFSSKIFTHFKNTSKISKSDFKKVVVTGNPIRGDLLNTNFFTDNKEKKRILVFGGSLGAKSINQFIQKVLNSDLSIPLSIKHQVGIGQEFETKKLNENIEYVQLPYIDDMVSVYKWADLIICRAGASTIAELRAVGKPTILIPFQHATDDHQSINAKILRTEVRFPVEIIPDNELDESGITIIEKILGEHYENRNAIYSEDASQRILDEIMASL